METILIYILKVTICLSIFYITYKGLLAKETFFGINRIVLLLGIATSLCLPFVTISITNTPSIVSQLENIIFANDTSPIESIEMQETAKEEFYQHIEPTPHPIQESSVAPDKPTTISWFKLIAMIYLLGVVVNIAALIISYQQILKLVKNRERREYNDITYGVVDKNISPFSWGKYIVLSKNETKELEAIITHEAAHIKRLHFLDILFSEIVLAFHWFNPFAWKLKQELKDIHEFQADNDVISSGINASKYQLLILEKAVGTSSYALANSFNHSKIKKRITMMLKQKSKSWNRLKLLFLIPVILSTVYVFSCTEVNSKGKSIENLVETETIELPDDSILRSYHPPVLDKDTKRVIGYGMRKDPIYGTMKLHIGTDYTAPEGSTIYAIKDGEVVEASTNKGGYGNLVKLAHGNDVETWYAHNKENLVQVGDKVQTGQPIALVGNTGKSTAPHLHFEIRKNGKPINPFWIIGANDLKIPIHKITEQYLDSMTHTLVRDKERITDENEQFANSNNIISISLD